MSRYDLEETKRLANQAKKAAKTLIECVEVLEEVGYQPYSDAIGPTLQELAAISRQWEADDLRSLKGVEHDCIPW